VGEGAYTGAMKVAIELPPVQPAQLEVEARRLGVPAEELARDLGASNRPSLSRGPRSIPLTFIRPSSKRPVRWRTACAESSLPGRQRRENRAEAWLTAHVRPRVQALDTV
jgi:hypothetical protein